MREANAREPRSARRRNVCRVHGRLRGRHGGRRMMGLRGGAFKCAVRARLFELVQLDQRNGSTYVRAGTPWRARGLSAIGEVSGCDLCDPHERGVGPEHGMNYDCEFSSHRDGSALEADALLEFQPPCPQVAVGKAAGQDDHCRLIEKASHMAVAAPGYVTIVVDFPGLIAPGGQAQPGPDRAGPSEVVGVFDSSHECGCRDLSTAEQKPARWRSKSLPGERLWG